MTTNPFIVDSTSGLVTPRGNVYVTFSAGRREVNGPECRLCGTAIHQHGDSWVDGHCSPHDAFPQRHSHTPAVAIGPTFGPMGYLDITYLSARYDGETLAYFDTARGDWVLTDLAGAHAGEAYSDLTIWPSPARRDDEEQT